MNTKIKLYTFLLGIFTASVLTVGCQKSNPVKYSEKPMVYIYKDGFSALKDSASYSFIVKSETLVEDVVEVPLRIMGLAENRDRVVNFGVKAEGTSAVSGVHYEIPPVVIPAGQYTTTAKIKVKRAADLKTQEVRLWVAVNESVDFLPGMDSTRTAASGGNNWGTGLTYLIKINDFYSKPSNWDTSLRFYFGASFSQAKFKFLVEATGKTEFPSTGEGALAYGEFTYLGALVKSKYAKHVAEHGPIINEFEEEVTFQL